MNGVGENRETASVLVSRNRTTTEQLFVLNRRNMQLLDNLGAHHSR